MSLKLPAISTASIPIRSSSTAGSSPITPLSDLSGSSGGKYCIYPSATTPTRELTPPPTTSRFAPLFKSISYEGDNDNVARGASIPLTGPHHSNPFDSQPTFSPTISRPVPSNLSFVPRSSYVEPAPRSAPLRVSHPSPWQNPTRAAEHIEKLNDVIQGLRHQLNLKSFDLDTAESELAQVSEAYALLVKEKAIVTHRFARAQERVEELELQVRAGQRYMVSQVPSRSQFAYPTARTESEGDDFKPWSDFQHLEHREQRHSIWEDRLKPIDLNTLRRNSIPETEGASSAVSAEDSKGHTTPDKDAVQAVLTSAPTLPECDLSRVDAKFLHPSFDFALWVKTCGLKLPAKILLLACVGWKDRLEMTDQKLAAIGVDNDNDRAYILRVFYSVSNGEVRGISSCLSPHTLFTVYSRAHAWTPRLRTRTSRTNNMLRL